MNDEPERRRSQDAAMDMTSSLHGVIREQASQIRDLVGQNEKLCESRHKLGVATLPALLRWGIVGSLCLWLATAVVFVLFAIWAMLKMSDLESMFLAATVSDVRTKEYSETLKDIKEKIEKVEAEAPVDADPPSEEPASEVVIPPAPTPEE